MQYDHYNVKIDAFEGPLDLLLHLINRLEIDIYDIPVSEITEQYLIYIHTMKELQLDVASEYLVMAATLLAIKSKMLLPKHDEEELEDEFGMEMEEDPRDELVERLIEYRKYKEAAEELKEREQDRSLMYTKPPADLSEYVNDSQQEKADLNVSLYDMLGALQKLLRRKKLQRPLSAKVARQEIPIEKRMSEIVDQLRNFKGRKKFTDLFPISDREHIVVTFLAVLELIKRKEILVEQDRNFSDIFVASMEGEK
ncbi:segregation/condensation protein A [Bacillus sp. CMF12]|uniref:segregation/condensation protein A n=1 Tax=Bacillaceae TaxID=186817 RepID=UPI001C8E3B26|nr:MULTISPECIES: segregation/condensation protein A [Bacillaceae]MBX9972889.1 segregation/condensation protein A [Cytobacillus firmus]MDM5229312.1 segregation/condensation protein A [Cytobacillus sp. NJ13]UOE54274.1 segregation/condensation protein A [Cytobacillus oceanisediminis]USK48726.1 segregation/condensation protein A [Bacillus sp. CMF12]